MQRAIPTCLMRGGTSKGIFLYAKDLPPAGPLRDAVILRIFGSPDVRQIDGLAGADVLTSKLAIIGPPSVPGADVDYTFGQVSFVKPQVDYGGNCGNLSSAVGPFVIDEGIVPPPPDGQDTVTINIHNTNTGAILRATVSVSGGRVCVDGDTEIGGVPGSGARIDLDFSATQGSVTGALLPTGLRVEQLLVPGAEDGSREAEELLEATLLDAGQPMVFVDAAALLGAGSGPFDVAEAAARLDADQALLRRVERLRGAAAVRMGIVGRWQDAESLSPYTPFVALVAPPPPGAAAAWDLSAVCVFMQRVHKAYAVTGSVATTAAALLPGTLPHRMARPTDGLLRIGHPSGVMEVHGAVEDGSQPKLLKAAITRTARRLMDGNAYIPWSVWPAESKM
ncbi:unnamed protein product [Polarella glacialis]|uniref:3-methylitaconate isomerase n=1 Tax=Polarella glacialis TaxID=89957 RepID=A0A813F5C5_POLGL|nr:unnamed protein product [Polarella glacialis]